MSDMLNDALLPLLREWVEARKRWLRADATLIEVRVFARAETRLAAVAEQFFAENQDAGS